MSGRSVTGRWFEELPVAASLVPDRAYRDPEDFLDALASAGQTMLEATAVRA